jgi:dTDP-4-dehydrorhamnose 3,5-epimerase
MNRLSIRDTPLAGMKVIERQQMGDDRGFLERLFCSTELSAAGWNEPIAQINHTFTQKQGSIRGLHFQHPPHSEMKLVSCLRGAIWDVAVDLRVGSPTFLFHHAEELSADNHRALLIPKGFAHGFQTMCDSCELLYLHSSPYLSAAEDGLHPQDPSLSIKWPLAITGFSKRDHEHVMLGPWFKGVEL